MDGNSKTARRRREPTGVNIHGETMVEYYQRRTNERGADIELLRSAIRDALDLMRNPHDGGEYEDGEMPVADVLRKALAEVKG